MKISQQERYIGTSIVHWESYCVTICLNLNPLLPAKLQTNEDIHLPLIAGPITP